MGLLTEGTPLSWEETKALSKHVREHGTLQFINLYHKAKNRQDDVLKWGDELEYLIVKFDDKNKTARLSLRGAEVLEELQNENQNLTLCGGASQSLWHPEYAAFMLEGMPAQPYGERLAHFNVVESNMKYRRIQASRFLHPEERLMTITNFPRLGCSEFTDPIFKPDPLSGATNSLFIPEEAIYLQHPSFKAMAISIHGRRGEKVVINVPIYKDAETSYPFIEDFSELSDEGESQKAALPDHIYMDDTGFGYGCCGLQATFQAPNINEARRLYDHLAPICPIMLALTAATPFYRGFITDVDCRWNVISESTDWRTRGERGLKPLEPGEQLIPKLGHGTICTYISHEGEKFNDGSFVFNEASYKQIIDAEIDPLLAKHFAHLFIRDPNFLYHENIEQDDSKDTDHFEIIQTTNWQLLRFKPPSPDSQIGWRVEFRSCEVQITDFENAAMVCFVNLLTRVILSHEVDFIIPITKLDENMQNAQERNAVKTKKFWFKKDINTNISKEENNRQYPGFSCDSSSEILPSYEDISLMTINEIVNGKDGEFTGLIPLINSYLSRMKVDADTHGTIQQYLKLIQQRASAKVMTTAQWLRSFVTSHQDYKKDSVISERINYDLLKTVDDIQNGIISCPELLGPLRPKILCSQL